jgi:tight adherence protein B
VTPEAGLAAAAAVSGVLGAWEGLAAVERTRMAAAVGRLVAPVVRAGREGVAPTRPERRRLAVLAAAGLAAAGWLLAGAVAATLAAVAGPVLAAGAIRARRRRFRAALGAAAPSVARALADALSAGHAVRGALALAASGATGAAGHELGAAVHALRLGAPTGAVLESLRRRAASPAWDSIVAAILLQRDAGCDLPALLRELAAALEAAARQDRDALAATAQARFTARIVLVLPIGAALLAELAHPGFVTGLLADPVSAFLTCFALVLQVVALFCVHRLARNVLR